MGKVRDKVFARLFQKNTTLEDNYFEVYDNLMVEYGWIHPDEYAKLPQQTINNLVNCINKRRNAEKNPGNAKTSGRNRKLSEFG